MKKQVILTSLVLASLSLYECKTVQKVFNPSAGGSASVTASIETENLFSCCDPRLKMPDGKPVWCEASAVLYEDGFVFVANDKDMPGKLSPVFRKRWNEFTNDKVQPAPLLAKAFLAGKKYEDFASNGEYVFLTTAFDRVKPGSTEWDAYNTLLYWKRGDEGNPQVLAPDASDKTSVAYREKFSQVLSQNRPAFPNGMPYFKVEGLAVMDTLLLFGIREEGEKFDKFDYRVRIVAVPFAIQKSGKGERIVLKDNWRVVTDFDPNAVAGLPKAIALSSLEYDRRRNIFWMLTSTENEGQLDAYLWTATPDAVMNNRPFTLVRDSKGQPLHFGHKAEDLTFLDRHHLLVIHDDDRVLSKVGEKTRQSNQAAYTVVKIK